MTPEGSRQLGRVERACQRPPGVVPTYEAHCSPAGFATARSVPPEAQDYIMAHKEAWEKARLDQLCAWRPVLMLELLDEAGAPPALQDIARSLASNRAYREGLAKHLQAAVGREVSFEDGDGNLYADTLRELGPELRERLKSSIAVPPAAEAFLQESSRVFATNHLLSLYREPLEARAEPLREKVKESLPRIERCLLRLPEASDQRIRLATRLQAILYPPRK
jgi:hypothetical protein